MFPAAHYLRPEAGPVEYPNLSEYQKAAYRRLAEMLAQAASELPDPRQAKTTLDSTVFRIDLARKTRVALLSGGRGTGKTSTLLSLIRDIETGAASERSKNDTIIPTTLKEAVKGLRGRLIWLDMLDMSPLPAMANLFSAILVRIEEAARRLPAEATNTSARGMMAPPATYESPLDKLLRLQTDVAVSWEGNLLQRASAMDANAFATEVRRAEHVRLKLNERLAEVLDGFGDQFGKVFGGPTNPVFVLPIDDFDLNPRRCLEMLELLRTLSVPRLFFVVLGDTEVAEVMCGLRIAGDMARVAEPASQGGFLPAHTEQVRSIVANVSGNILRKLLPPGQRVHIGSVKLDEALQFRPSANSDNTSIKEWLQKVKIPLEKWSPEVRKRFRLVLPKTGETSSTSEVPLPDSITLHDFLTAEGWSVAPDRSGQQFYHARKFLRMPLRYLVDLWFVFAQKVRSEPLPNVNEVFQEVRAGLHVFCRDVVQAETSFPSDVRWKFTTLFDVDPDAGWTISADPFTLAPTRYPFELELRPTTILSADTKIQPAADVQRGFRFRASTGWEFRDKGNKATATDWHPLFLSPATTDLIIFYTDLVTLARGDGERNPLLDLGAIAWHFAGVRFEVKGLPGTHLSWYLGWPPPPVLTFWEADRFFDGWLQVVRRIEDARKTSEPSIDPSSYLVFEWLNLGSAVLSGEPPLVVLGDLTPVRLDNWEKLAQRVENLRSNHAHLRGGDRVIQWIADILALLNSDMVGADPIPPSAFRKISGLLSLGKDRGQPFAIQKLETLRGRNIPNDVLNNFFHNYRRMPLWWNSAT